MGTGVIMSTPTRDGIRTGSITTTITTTTAADKLGNTRHALGPAGCGAQVPAREIARMHGTPIYVLEKGKVVAKDPNDDEK
jgi:hypothetical protein